MVSSASDDHHPFVPPGGRSFLLATRRMWTGESWLGMSSRSGPLRTAFCCHCSTLKVFVDVLERSALTLQLLVADGHAPCSRHMDAHPAYVVACILSLANPVQQLSLGAAHQGSHSSRGHHSKHTLPPPLHIPTLQCTTRLRPRRGMQTASEAAPVHVQCCLRARQELGKLPVHVCCPLRRQCPWCMCPWRPCCQNGERLGLLGSVHVAVYLQLAL